MVVVWALPDKRASFRGDCRREFLEFLLSSFRFDFREKKEEVFELAEAKLLLLLLLLPESPTIPLPPVPWLFNKSRSTSSGLEMYLEEK